ncbi:MAG: hypothetical protein QHH02_03450, partial [Syntrophomonadaceae bacterium]|nr:hypothetical protein [Syntrophomonadaceae bacterium]
MTRLAIDHAWLIPLIPGAAFALIALLLRRSPGASAAASIAAMLASLVISLLAVAGVLAQPAVYEYSARWFSMNGLDVEMGILIDPIAAVMLLVVTLVALMVQIYSLGYMHGDPGFTSYFAYQSLFAASMLGLVLAVPVALNRYSRNICDVKDAIQGLGVALGLALWLLAGLARG